MAISDMKGTVTTTGKMNNAPETPKAADLSQMNKLFERKTKSTKVAEQSKQMPVEQPKDMGLMEKVQNLTDQDKAVLATVLSPSVSNALKKIAPELTPLLDQAGTSEENVIIPVSVVKNFATKRYGGQNETEAVTSFIADLQGSVPGMDNTMDQTNVPPETEAIDQDIA
tara:strand:+ start:401 stop:907 length:507 start_codon:yes stop_codon:yes gene_type:complete